MKQYHFPTLVLALSLFAGSCLKENPVYEATPSPVIILEDVRALYQGVPLILNSDKLNGAGSITGVVISDAAAGNLRKGTVVIQQTKRNFTRGITLDLGTGSNLPYQPGDSLIVSVTGAKLANVSGTLQISGLTPAAVTLAASNRPVTPVITSLAELDSNFRDYESVLVQVVGATLDPAPTGTDTYSGDKSLTDASGGRVTLHTDADAGFAQKLLPVNATFTGIAVWSNPGVDSREGAKKQLRMRNGDDVRDASGSQYFLESFENGLPLKATYTAGTSTFPTSGMWFLDGAGVNNTANDAPVSGTYALRVNQNLSTPALIEMRFDLPDGASKFSVWYSSYAASADLPSTWMLEYSTDAGNTWKQTGEKIRAVSKVKAIATFTMDIRGPVRFRINKLGLGSNATDPTIENGRLSIDDISIYRKP